MLGILEQVFLQNRKPICVCSFSKWSRSAIARAIRGEWQPARLFSFLRGMVQVSAASRVSEDKVLAHPASGDSIPTSADKEDHVSIGTIAARKARDIVTNVEQVLAMELLCATQGLEFLLPLRPGRGIHEAYKVVREEVPPITGDRRFSEDIRRIQLLIESGEILRRVEKGVGKME